MKKTSSYRPDRAQAEQKEKLPVTTVAAPEERFQDTQQVANMADTTAKPNTDSFIKKKVKSKGATLRQEVVAEALGMKGAGGSGVSNVASPSAFGLRSISFSGDTGTILGNASGTPSMEVSNQGSTRIDKRLSDVNKDINFNASEQVMVDYDNIPPLAASEGTVGYNGNPKNIAARSQKKTGYTPAELLYDRSLDFVEKDSFIFSCGQVVKQKDVDYKDYPTSTLDADDDMVDFNQVRGNYSPRELVVKIKRTGGKTFVSSFHVTEDDLSCNNEKDVTVNGSATNAIIDMNRAELARQTIDADAGSPTAEHFNPLGRSVNQPTQTVGYLQDIENVMGAEVFAAYKFANKARAHFLSRTAKDGQALVSPGVDALYGHLTAADCTKDIYTVFDDLGESFFSKKGMAAGSAAIMIPLFDSKGKYKTKGDLVNQPRGLKMHLQTADNNMNPFRAKSEFIAAINAVDCYSTIDHEYDPTAPVYITDNVRLIHPYSWSAALDFVRDNNGVKTYNSVPFKYNYSAGSGLNSYFITVGEPVLNGIAYFLDLHANEAFDALHESGDEVTWTIPIVHSTTHFSLWDLLVCASTPYIIYERTNALKDILDYELFYKYPFLGNVAIKDANPLNAVNYGTISPYAQMTTKVMQPSSAIRWKYPEILSPITDGDRLLPFYFNEASYNLTGSMDKPTLTDKFEENFTTPVVRSGVKLSGLDDFFGLDVRDQLLITDRMTRIPGNPDRLPVDGYIYKYSQDSDGIPVLKGSYLKDKTVADYCSTPRLLGWYFDAPGGTCCVYSGTALTPMADISIDAMVPSFRAIEYKGVYGANDVIVDKSLQVGSININRAQAFVQQWFRARIAAVWPAEFDLVLSLNEALSYNDEAGTNPRFITLSEKAQFSPFVYAPYAVEGSGAERHTTNSAYSVDVDDRTILFSPHFMLWTLLQKLPFIINPFESFDLGKPGADPFGVAYLFGLAGFMAANYDEEIYNRANAAQNQGYGYTHDPMTSVSPIFKDSYSMTQIG